ncbi:type II secretion system protein GspL [Aquipseudomonas alcaligenes]|uniref:Type II secretion system protein L n=1 Tax=Aquipseudomonas alcaligenes TaxID=43263 RepID=A0A2V4LGQ3_AQUAC|nr:type II secretion system protein GspL [Pseudomonas alcaligenes]PYC20237.1 type II secretion system protein GspL [Pseudomonas alcaligenes]
MSVTLFLPPQACTNAKADLPVWRVDDEDCQVLPFISAIPLSPETWRLVLPVEAVTVCAVHLPQTRPNLVQKALPYAVEEHLIEEVELFHLCVGQKLPDGRHSVFAVRKTWLEEWIGLCTHNPPHEIAVDADLLPGEGTRLLCMGNRWLVGIEREIRLVIGAEGWAELSEHCPRPRHAYWENKRPAPGTIESGQQVLQPLAWLAKQKPGTNLAIGPYARQEPGKKLGSWTYITWTLAVTVAILWTSNLAQALYLQYQGDRYAQANEEIYRRLFPQDLKIINLRAQFDEHLSQAQSNRQGSFLKALDVVATAITQERARIDIRQLDFKAQSQSLAIQLQAPDFATLERLKSRLHRQGHPVSMDSANREARGVTASMIIEAPHEK